MRHATSLCFLAASLLAAPAFAQNHLTWRACSDAPAATATETFACNTNLTPGGDPVIFRLVGSFVSASGVPQFVGLSALVEVATDGSALPSWWRLATGECREGSLNVSTAYGAAGLCTNPFAGAGTIGAGAQWQSEYLGNPSRARLRIDVAATAPSAVAAGIRYTAFDLRLDASRTIDDGTPACEGCCTPLCLALSTVSLYAENFG
jgi:hypothetical protein